MKIRNPIIKRLIVLIIIIVSCIVITFFAIRIIKNGYNHLYFDLGEDNNDKFYHDNIVSTYSDYLELSSEYDIKTVLNESDFQNNKYLFSIQDYDKCSEKKPKEVTNISVDEDTIKIDFNVDNKCGWCKKHIYVYLIKLPKDVRDNMDIEYQYNFSSELDCGSI